MLWKIAYDKDFYIVKQILKSTIKHLYNIYMFLAIFKQYQVVAHKANGE